MTLAERPASENEIPEQFVNDFCGEIGLDYGDLKRALGRFMAMRSARAAEPSSFERPSSKLEPSVTRRPHLLPRCLIRERTAVQ